MFAGGYWGNTGTGGQVTYIPLGELSVMPDEGDLILSEEDALILKSDTDILILQQEQTLVLIDDDENDLSLSR